MIAVAIAGACSLGAATSQLFYGIDFRWLVLIALTIVTSSVTVKVPAVAATLSVSEAFVFASVMLFGWPAGTVVASLDGLVISFWLHKRKPQPSYRILFNATAPALATFVAAAVYLALGAPSVSAVDFQITQVLVPLCAFAATYFLANTSLLAIAIGLEQGLSPFSVWRANFLWLWLNFFSGASIAALLVSFGGKNGDNTLGAIWVVLPLLGISYFTYKSSTARADDANRHLEQMNTLYLSTIETLAMAIDAKDQITHGHIRRVQTFAVALAKEVGITDDKQIKAIEAAALLHDMGKLAVPEYILNKPGALTPAEFDRMKQHAAVGADILSAIDFPYPVVPIVRHHHESWDGSGYPAGLKGADIPIGARVLSVVDCFDALTSDRPYRPRLTHEDALEVLINRRGTMYDPVIVDAFLRMSKSLRDSSLVEDKSAISSPSSTRASFGRLDAITASAGESRTMYRLIHKLAAQHSLDRAFRDIAEEIGTLIPATAAAVFVPTADGTELEATTVIGIHSDWLTGRRVRLGERIVGWSASSGRSVLNADASAEFGQLSRVGPFPLRSCMTVPVTVSGERLAVIAAFSTNTSGFRSEDQRIVEAVVRHALPVLDRLRSGSPSVGAERLATGGLELTPVGMIACRCSSRAAAGAEPVGIALAVIRRHLGSSAMTQIISGADIFVGIGMSDIDAIDQKAEQLRTVLLPAGLVDSEDHVVIAATPRDGTNLEHLLYACRQKLTPTRSGDRIH